MTMNPRWIWMAYRFWIVIMVILVLAMIGNGTPHDIFGAW
jgi:hypothetical protein